MPSVVRFDQDLAGVKEKASIIKLSCFFYCACTSVDDFDDLMLIMMTNGQTDRH